MRIVRPRVELLSITEDPLKLIEKAGRVCYKSEEKITQDSYRRFVKMLMGKEHESVLEHASATFHITCDRGVSHELVRHRIASYSQESTRYCNYGKQDEGVAFIMPLGIDGTTYPLWIQAMEIAEKAYLGMLEKGASPQLARSVLPNSLKTEIVMTANFREWRHFLKLRTAKTAHPQMQEIANMIGQILASRVEVLFDDYR